MSLESEVLIQQQLFGFGCCSLDTKEGEEGYNETLTTEYYSSQNNGFYSTSPAEISPIPTRSAGRRKRQRSTTTSNHVKNKEQVEHQRMTHITVERNRRKQMNHYLSLLKSIMPPSYVHRGDQASIVGGAINFVKELEQLLQSLEARKRIDKLLDFSNNNSDDLQLISDFFSFSANRDLIINKNNKQDMVGVTMVESHVNLKILVRRQAKLVLKMVTGLYSLSLTVLHINLTTFHHMLLFSICVKVEDECKMSSVNEISAAVYEMVGRFQEETVSNFSL